MNNVANYIKACTPIHQLLMVLVAVLFVSMNIGVLKYNELLSSLCIIGVSALALGTIMLMRGEHDRQIGKTTYRIILAAIFMTCLSIQAFIVYNIQLAYYSDFIIVRDQAIHFSEQYSILPEYETYFHFYPYQINIAVVLNALYRLLGNYHNVELFSAGIANTSAILAGIAVCNLTKNRRLSILTAVLCEVYTILCMKTYLPYTNNLGIIFPISVICLYTSQLKTNNKVFFMAVVSAIGTWIKITTIIPMIAIVIVEGVRMLRTRRISILGIGTLSFMLTYGTISAMNASLKSKMEFHRNSSQEHGYVYYFAMGQNAETGGQFNKQIGTLGDSLYLQPGVDANAYFTDMGIQSIKARSVIGHVKFFISKIAYCWGEVRLDHLYLGKYDRWLIILQHIPWYVALLMMTIGVCIVRDRKFQTMFFGIIGVVAYLYISEAGARYVFMYSPIIFSMMGCAIYTFSSFKNKICNTLP